MRINDIMLVDAAVRNIVSRICKQMDGETNFWKIAAAVTSDSEMLEIIKDPANVKTLITAYLYDRTRDAALGWDSDDDAEAADEADDAAR